MMLFMQQALTQLEQSNDEIRINLSYDERQEDISADEIDTLIEKIQQAPQGNFLELNLSGQIELQDSLQRITSVLFAAKQWSRIALDISACEITEREMTALVRHLSEVNHKSIYLNLGQNPLKVEQINNLLRSVSGLTQLELVIQYCDLTDDNFAELLPAITHCPIPLLLDLSQNPLTSLTAQRLLESMSENKHLEIIFSDVIAPDFDVQFQAFHQVFSTATESIRQRVHQQHPFAQVLQEQTIEVEMTSPVIASRPTQEYQAPKINVVVADETRVHSHDDDKPEIIYSTVEDFFIDLHRFHGDVSKHEPFIHPSSENEFIFSQAFEQCEFLSDRLLTKKVKDIARSWPKHWREKKVDSTITHDKNSIDESPNSIQIAPKQFRPKPSEIEYRKKNLDERLNAFNRHRKEDDLQTAIPYFVQQFNMHFSEFSTGFTLLGKSKNDKQNFFVAFMALKNLLELTSLDKLTPEQKKIVNQNSVQTCLDKAADFMKTSYKNEDYCLLNFYVAHLSNWLESQPHTADEFFQNISRKIFHGCLQYFIAQQNIDGISEYLRKGQNVFGVKKHQTLQKVLANLAHEFFSREGREQALKLYISIAGMMEIYRETEDLSWSPILIEILTLAGELSDKAVINQLNRSEIIHIYLHQYFTDENISVEPALERFPLLRFMDNPEIFAALCNFRSTDVIKKLQSCVETSLSQDEITHSQREKLLTLKIKLLETQGERSKLAAMLNALAEKNIYLPDLIVDPLALIETDNPTLIVFYLRQEKLAKYWFEFFDLRGLFIEKAQQFLAIKNCIGLYEFLSSQLTYDEYNQLFKPIIVESAVAASSTLTMTDQNSHVEPDVEAPAAPVCVDSDVPPPLPERDQEPFVVVPTAPLPPPPPSSEQPSQSNNSKDKPAPQKPVAQRSWLDEINKRRGVSNNFDEESLKAAQAKKAELAKEENDKSNPFFQMEKHFDKKFKNARGSDSDNESQNSDDDEWDDESNAASSSIQMRQP